MLKTTARNPVRSDVMARLARVAAARRTITYADIAKEFGGIPRGWSDRLTAIARHCHESGWPLLPVLVVNADTGLPSAGAAIYRQLGVTTPEALRTEQFRCHDFDWSKTPFWHYRVPATP